jgi:hypothetical protein
MHFFTKIFSRRRLSKPGAPEAVRFRAPAAQSVERVDVRDRAALDEWCARLNIPPERLIRTVIVVGDKLPDVQHHLKMLG